MSLLELLCLNKAHKESCKMPLTTTWGQSMEVTAIVLRYIHQELQLLCTNIPGIRGRSWQGYCSEDHNVRDIADQLRPLTSDTDLRQWDNNIADACDVWLSLLHDPVLAPHKAIVNKRFNQASTIEHLVAYALHPS